MWHAAQPVARKLPRTALAGVQRWHEVHSLRRRSKKMSPDSLKVGKGSRRATAPLGSGWPFGTGSPGVVGTGAMAKRTSSLVGWRPLGKRVPLCVPERWAMMEDFTLFTIAAWQRPQVSAATRRSLGLESIPAWACLASVAVALPRWHVVQGS